MGDYKLNGDILEILLWQLLDLRKERSAFKKLCLFPPKNLPPSYTMSDELLLSHSQHSQFKRLHLAVQRRLETLLKKTGACGVNLECAQLNAWQAYYNFLQVRSKDHEMGNSNLLANLQSCLTCAVQARHEVRWRFWKRSYRQILDFLILAIRLEMREISMPQPKVERMIQSLGNIRELKKELILQLQEGWHDGLYAQFKQLAAKSPYSLEHQFIGLLGKQMQVLSSRFRLLHSSKRGLGRFLGKHYQQHLLSQVDRGVKGLCSQLKISARHPQMSVELLEPLGDMVSFYWSHLSQFYEEQLMEYQSPCLAYWKLWVSASILSLGLSIAGVKTPPQFTKQIEDFKNFIALEPSSVWPLMALLVYLLRYAGEHEGNFDLHALECLGQILDTLVNDPNYSQWKDRACLSRMDMHLLYHRDFRAGPDEVMRLASYVLTIYPGDGEEKLLQTSFDLLDHLYDMWSGACFKSGHYT